MRLRTGPWNLTDLKEVRQNGKKVFSCFHCGGGSTMGYKLAGFDVVGGVEIDPKMMEVYQLNHKPRHSYLMGIQEFNQLPLSEIPEELFHLDILDGSPPCSSFSMAGSREKNWGKEKKFREGQAKQVLDDLFFEFIRTAERLKPKVVVAENVKGLISGNAKGYVKMIADAFNKAGYSLQLFLLNAAFMGVPQRRERVFFIARQKALEWKPIKMEFSEDVVSVKDVAVNLETKGRPLSSQASKFWYLTKAGTGFGPAGGFNTQKKISEGSPCLSLTASSRHTHWEVPVFISDELVVRLQSFPDDFNFLKNNPNYICGMSVPPFMMQRIAHEIYCQWLAPKSVTRKKPARQE